MRVAATFTLYKPCPRASCDFEFCAHGDYFTASVEGTATWSPEEEEVLFSDFAITGCEDGDVPTWRNLTRIERGFALDALHTAVREDQVRAEFEAALPYVLEEQKDALERQREDAHDAREEAMSAKAWL